jgi:hypothetical protein
MKEQPPATNARRLEGASFFNEHGASSPPREDEPRRRLGSRSSIACRCGSCQATMAEGWSGGALGQQAEGVAQLRAGLAARHAVGARVMETQ